MKLGQDDIRRRFRDCGLKLTPQRAAIYEALIDTTSHPTADELYRRVAKVHPMISPNTVYYTLAALQRAGLVCEVNYWHDGARFDANMTAHHHLICVGCRRIEDLEDKALNCLSLSRGRRGDFQIMGHRVEFHGYCGACAKQQRRATAKSKPQSRHSPKGRAV